MKKSLSFFSWLFHPLFVPLYGSWYYLFRIDNYFEPVQKYLILLQVCIVLVFIPLCVFYLLRTLGKADSVMLSEVSQRKIPLGIQAFLVVILMQKSAGINSVPQLYFFFAGGLSVSLILLGLSLFGYRASIHMAGMAMLGIYVIALSIHEQINSLYGVAFIAFASGLVATSRLEMQAHKFSELLAGAVAGTLPQILFWCFWL